MNFILKIAPPFLRRLDSHLRINHSWIWTTKIHLHIYLSILLAVFFSIIGCIYQIDLNEVPRISQQNSFFIMLFLPAVFLGAYMIYNMSLFNTDKSHGHRFRYQEVLLFLITFFTFCLPLLIPFPAAFILNSRIADLENDRQFKMDQDAFVMGLPYFPFEYGDYNYFPSDSVYINAMRMENDYEIRNNRYYNHMRDSIFWHKGIFKNERPYLYYTGNPYWSYRDPMHQDHLIKVNTERDPKVAVADIAKMERVVNKYSKGILLDKQTILDHYLKNYYLKESVVTASQQHSVDVASNNIENIQLAKQRYIHAWSKETHSFFALFIFCFTILFRVFKNVHWKQLLLSFAIILVGLTLIAIFEDSFRMRGRFISNVGLWLPLALLAISVKGFSIRHFNWIYSQANILLSFFLPFFPMIILHYLVLYFNILEIPYFDQYKEIVTEPSGFRHLEYSTEYYLVVSSIWSFTFWLGILSFTFLWNPYLKTLYLRYWSLPKTR
jgi:hypothetical protein